MLLEFICFHDFILYNTLYLAGRRSPGATIYTMMALQVARCVESSSIMGISKKGKPN
jgi:hypothetical protein